MPAGDFFGVSNKSAIFAVLITPIALLFRTGSVNARTPPGYIFAQTYFQQLLLYGCHPKNFFRPLG
jgi:hypothetical protein